MALSGICTAGNKRVFPLHIWEDASFAVARQIPAGKFTNIVCLNHSLALQSVLWQKVSNDFTRAKRIPMIPKGFKGLPHVLDYN